MTVRVLAGFLACGLAACTATRSRPDSIANAPVHELGQQPELDATIELATFSRELMAQAIFLETNKVRAGHGLPNFQSIPKLNDAADLEAAVGRVATPPSHTNPFPAIGTPLQRVRFVGLEPTMVAENIAVISIYDTGPRTDVGVVVRDGVRLFVDPVTQVELRPSSYRQFATTVVRNWMQSPGHRGNILNPALRALGCGVLPTVSVLGVDQLFCVQVFFTARK